MSIKIHKDGKWQLFPGTGVGGSTNSYTKEESDNKYALKSDVTTVSGKVDDLEERIDQINTGGNCEDCINQSELESAISGVNSKIDNLVTTVSGKVDTGSYLFTLNGDQVNQGDSVNVAGSGTSITIDSVMDPNSENPVQNKVIYNAIDTLTDAVTDAFTIANQKFEDLDGFRTNRYNAIIASGTTQIKWKDVSSTSPLYLKTINGISIIGNSENDNITISGGSGTVTESKPSVIVFAYIQSNEKPISEPNVTVDSEGNPSYIGEWKSISDMSDAISNKLQIWYSYATFVVGGNIVGSWSDPIPFAKDGLPGQDGTPGKDGIGVEYIYYRSNDNVIPSLPANANSWEWDNVPENAGGWTDNPTGVDKDHQFEFVSVRTGNATNINPWSVPTLWSKYGVNGVDGDTIEYIYKLSQTATVLPTEYPDNSWEYDNPDPTKPESDVTRWQDNPPSVSESYPYCFVSIRKGQMIEVVEGDTKYNKIDGNWSIPAVWSKWSKDGETPDTFYSALVNIYKRADSLPDKPADGDYIYDFVEGKITSGDLNDWSINVPDNTAMYLYQCSAYVTSNNTTGVINSWSDPICIASNGENGSGQSAVYLDLTNDSPYIIIDSKGNITSEQTVTTNVHMYYGTTKQVLTDCFVEGHANDPNVSVTNDVINKCANISITYPVSNTPITSTLTYTITATATINDSSVSKSIILNVIPVKQAEDGKSPVIYTLTPSANTIVLDPNSEDLTPKILQCAVTRIEGNTSKNVSVNTEGIKVSYKIDEGEPNDYNQQFDITYAALETCSFLTFILNVNNEDGIYEIKQVIPILRIGLNGTDGSQGPQGPAGDNGETPYILSIDNDHFTIAVDNNGAVIADQTILSVLHLYHGEEINLGAEGSPIINYTSDDINIGTNNVTISEAPIASLKSGYPIWIKFSKGYNINETSVEDAMHVINVTINTGTNENPNIIKGAIKVRYSNAGIYNLILTPHTVVIDKDGSKSVNQLTAQIQREIITSDFKETKILTGNEIPDDVTVVLINDTSSTVSVEQSLFTRPTNNDGTEFTLDITGITFQSNPYVVIKDGSINLDREDLTVVRNGQNGSNGSNGYTQVLLQIYKRSASKPSISPDTVTFNLSDGTWNVPTDWDNTIPPVNGDPCWVSTAFINSNESAGTVSVKWSDPVKLVEDGKTGSEGRALYAAGLWNSLTEYERTANFTPYVLWKEKYYVLIQDGKISGESTEPGTTTGDMWNEMTSMDVVYARVLMTEMGTIGDATFYNNLMFSKKDAKGNQVIDKGENNPFETVNGTTTIKMGSSNKPTMAIDFNSGEAYFADGNLKLNSDGHISVANIEYDITNVSSTITDEEQVSNFYYYNIPITDLACVVDSNATITDINGNIIKDPSSASIGDTFISYYFNLPNKYIEDKTTVSEGVVINTGDYKIDIIVKNKYNIYYQGNHITNKVILQPKSIMKYYYYYMSDSADLLFIDVLGVKSTTQEGVLIIGKE